MLAPERMRFKTARRKAKRNMRRSEDNSKLVYSTDRKLTAQRSEPSSAETPHPRQQDLRVSLDRKGRKGKAVTLVKGFRGTEDDLKNLGKLLKKSCGVGGSVKNNEILVQGDHCKQVTSLLQKQGYNVKRAGG